jgi:beta-phosphoglucomutase
MMLLQHFNIDNIFNVMIFGEQVEKGKPDPECYIKCFDLLGVNNNQCLIFEDSKVGIQSAENAGAAVISVNGWVS